jgi:AhpD family alkylhydroperoxidase
MTGIFVRATRRGAQRQITYVTAVGRQAASGRVAEIYDQVESDFGILAPPVILHSPAPDALAACWMTLRETLVASGKTDRAIKEAVAAAVSLGNSCPYCVDVHSMTLHGLVSGRDAAAVAADRFDAISDPRIRAVATWARDLGTPKAGEAPFPVGEAPELIGVAVVFHYLNRMVNVFLSESPFPPGLPANARGGMMRMIGRYLRPTSLRHREPGASLHLLPPARLPDELSWASESPTVADAFARATAALDAVSERSVSADVRSVVATELAAWDGRPPALGQAWVDDALSGLPASDRAAGRLALLTAMASYRITASVIDDYRRDHPGDTSLVELTGWAAVAAARRAGRV